MFHVAKIVLGITQPFSINAIPRGSYGFDIEGAKHTLPNYWGGKTYDFAPFSLKRPKYWGGSCPLCPPYNYLTDRCHTTCSKLKLVFKEWIFLSLHSVHQQNLPWELWLWLLLASLQLKPYQQVNTKVFHLYFFNDKICITNWCKLIAHKKVNL